MSLFLQSLIITLGLIMMLTKPVYAETNCQTIYGGGQTCTTAGLAVQKQVLNPQTGVYVHDLGLVDNKFMPGDRVTFEITVTNTGPAVINNVEIVDPLPSHMMYVSSSLDIAGDRSNPTFSMGDFAPGDSRSVTLTVQLDSAQGFGNNGNVCIINEAHARGDNVTIPAFDSSQICVFHPQNFPAPSITTTPVSPNTGPGLFTTLLIPTTGMLGLAIKRMEYRLFKKKGNL